MKKSHLMMILSILFILSSNLVSANECSDGIDNDGDGCIDYPSDIYDCTSYNDDTESGSSCSDYPSDPGFAKQWYLNNMGQINGILGIDVDAIDSWNIEKGNENIIIAVLSTGIDYFHEDFNECEGDNCKILEGYDVIDNDNNAQDSGSRGTSISAIASAGTNEFTNPLNYFLTSNKILLNITGANLEYGTRIVNLHELEVYEPNNNQINLALNAVASSSRIGENGHLVEHVNDANIYSFWSVTSVEQDWVVLEWSEEINFNKIIIKSLSGLQPVNYTISYWDNEWIEIFSVTNNQQNTRIHTYYPEIEQKGTSGMCWDCKILPVRIRENDNSVMLEDVIEGLQQLSQANTPADIVVLDYYTYEDSQELRNAINTVAQNSIIIAPVGDDKYFWKESYPGAYDNVLGVAASDNNNNLYASSNKNSWDNNWINLASPGVSLWTARPSNNYAYLSGSHYASGLVAGILGIIKSYYPQSSNEEIIGRLLAGTTKTNNNYLSANAFNPLIIEESPYITLNSIEIEDDGIISPGETVDLSISIKNEWINANNVVAGLISNTESVIINSEIKNYGNINNKEIKSANHRLTFTGKNPEIINISLLITADNYEQIIPIIIPSNWPAKEGWPIVPDNKAKFTYINTGQFDEDIETELVSLEYLYGNSKIHVYNHDSTPVNNWPINAPNLSNGQPPVIIDLNNDGYSDILFKSSDSKKLFAYSHTGEESLIYESENSILGFSSDNFDNNGNPEIVLLESGHDYFLYNITILSSSGHKIYTQQFEGMPSRDSLVITNLDNEGIKEVLFYDNYGKVRIINLAQGNTEFNYAACYDCFSGDSLAVADLDNDGNKEIAISTGDHFGLMNNQGSLIIDLWSGTYDAYKYSLAIGNIDGDTDLEVVYFSQGFVYSDDYPEFGTVIKPYNHDGSIVNSCWEDTFWERILSYPLLADIDGDKKSEILISFEEGIRAYNEDCTFFYVALGENNEFTFPIIFDTDKDGKAELYFSDQRILSYEMPAKAVNYDWPMNKHNPQKTSDKNMCLGSSILSDLDRDNDVDAVDLRMFNECYTQENILCDVNSDGEVNSEDLEIFSLELGFVNECSTGINYYIKSQVCSNVCEREINDFGICNCKTFYNIKKISLEYE